MNVQLYANGPVTRISGQINSTQTSINVTAATGFPASGDFTIMIDYEVLLVTAVNGTTWTVARGQEGTTACLHVDQSYVTMPLTKASLERLHVVSKAGTVVGDHRVLNFVDTDTVTWTLADDAANGRINLSAAAAGGTGGGGGGGFSYERTPTAVPKVADFETLYNNTGQTYLYDYPCGLGVYDVSHNSQSMRMLMSKTPVPAVPWCVTARLDGYTDQSGDEFGMFVWDGAPGSSTYKNWMALSYNNTKIRQIQATDATGAITAGTELAALTCGFDVKWFRITQHDSKRFWQVSKDGYNWMNIAAAWDYFMGFCQNPTHAGIYVNANNNWGRDLAVTCGYFKVDSWTTGT